MHQPTPSSIAIAARAVLYASLLGSASLAWAQATSHTAAQAGSQAASQTGNAMAEITVTAPHPGAQKVEPPSEQTRSYRATSAKSATGMALSVQETPQAVTVITHQQMQDQNLQTLVQALDSTPGVSSQALDRGRATFSARGFGIDKYQVDGLSVNWSGPWAVGEALIDTVLYDRIEVVRGSTGLLNGAGNPSASVNLMRKHANSRTRQTAVEAGLGSEGDWKATLDHTQPFNADGSVRGRFVVHHHGGDTFIDRETSKQNTLYGVVDADLSAATQISAGMSLQQTRKNSAMWGGLPVLFDDGTLTNWDHRHNSSANWSYWNSDNINLFVDGTHQLNDRWSISLKANQRRFDGNSKLFYFSGNTVNRADGLGWSPWPGKFNAEGKQNTAQLQVDGQFDAWGQQHDVIFGAQYNKQRRTARSAMDTTNIADATNFFTWDGSYPEPTWGPFGLSLDQIDTESALYAATRLRVGEKLAIIGGTRLTNWKSVSITPTNTTEQKPSTVWTPYLGVLYDITPQHTVYASYTSIFKPQTQRDANNELLDPIEGKSYEVGLKSSFLDGNLGTQISLFQTRQENLAQVTDQYIAGVTPPTYAYRAAKGAKVKGFEVEAAGNLTANLQLGGGYSIWSGEDASGAKLNTTTPRKQFKVFASYNASELLPGLTLGGGINWQSRIYTNTSNAATGGPVEYGQNAYALVNLMARYEVNDQLSAQLNISNALDKKYINQLSFNQYGYGDPRHVSLSVRYSF